jgi:hypothetical protein
MASDRRVITIDGFQWPPDALLERMRSPELPPEEFWRCMSYALFVMRDDEEYIASLNAIKKERTHFAFPQQEATTPQNEMPDAPPRVWGKSSYGDTPKVFHDNLDDNQIASALLHTDKLGLGPKQFALAVQEFFLSISWLVNTIDTQFIGWMKFHQIMTAASNDLQHVRQNDTMDQLKDNLKSTFQFLNNKDVWEDLDKFYKKDSHGNALKKINNGL